MNIGVANRPTMSSNAIERPGYPTRMDLDLRESDHGSAVVEATGTAQKEVSIQKTVLQYCVVET